MNKKQCRKKATFDATPFLARLRMHSDRTGRSGAATGGGRFVAGESVPGFAIKG